MYVLIFEMLMDNSMGWVPWVLYAMLSNRISGFTHKYGKYSYRIFHMKDSYNVQPYQFRHLKPYPLPINFSFFFHLVMLSFNNSY